MRLDMYFFRSLQKYCYHTTVGEEGWGRSDIFVQVAEEATENYNPRTDTAGWCIHPY